MAGNPIRRAGTPWRILVHDMQPRGLSGHAYHIKSDARFGRLPPGMLTPESRAQLDELETLYSSTTVLHNTDFDELVVGRWIHLEQMDTGRWWMNIGGVTVLVQADREGRPREVSVFGPEDYDEPVDGCRYRLAWGEHVVEAPQL